MVVGLIEGRRRVQTVIISVSVKNRCIEGRPLDLQSVSTIHSAQLCIRLLTPALESELAIPEPPVIVLFGAAVTTSRKELPVAVLPAIRRPLPFKAVKVLVLSFSFVLDASDLESSG